MPEEVLGERVRTLRTARGWSQEELAREMTGAGFAWRQSTAAKTEAADRPLRVNEAAALAEVLGIPVEDLVKPDIHPLVLRAQKEASNLARAEQELARVSQEQQRLTWLADFARAQLAALQALLRYVEQPGRENLEAALPLVIPRFVENEEWKVLLEEAGLSRKLIDQAYDRFMADNDLSGSDGSAPTSNLVLDDVDDFKDPAHNGTLRWFAGQVSQRLLPMVLPKEGGDDGKHREAP